MSRKARRARFLAGTATAFAGAAFSRVAAAPEFVYRFGHDQTVDYPLHVRAVQMAADVNRETNGRLEIRIFPNSILGSDPAMIEQVRVGALEFSSQSAGLLSGVAPPAAIQQIPYAFSTEEQAVGAMTGEFGNAIRGEVALKTGFHFFPVMLNSGFTEITSSTHPIRKPDDLVGFKVRSRDVALNVDMYKVYGAQVVPISLGEVYSALQTRVVDGQDNIYGIIEAQRLYEVQKYLSVVDLVWGGQFFYCGGDAWKRLPPDIQAVVERNAILYGRRSVRDSIELNVAVANKLGRQGLAFNTVDKGAFKTKLGAFYTKWKAFFGPRLWGLLEEYSGKLG